MNHHQLQEYLTYYPNEGLFRWNIKPNKSVNIDDNAGYISSKDGYCRITIRNKKYKRSRLAWFYMTGEWPKNEIDHVDRNPSNDSWINLRESTRSQQLMNRGKRGKLPKWVAKNTQGYNSRIKENGKYKYLGTYKTPDEAHKVALLHAKKLHGDFFCCDCEYCITQKCE